MNPAALKLAVAAYDEARCASHGPFEKPMSDRNRETISPMIAAAITAYNTAKDSELAEARVCRWTAISERDRSFYAPVTVLFREKEASSNE